MAENKNPIAVISIAAIQSTRRKQGLSDWATRTDFNRSEVDPFSTWVLEAIRAQGFDVAPTLDRKERDELLAALRDPPVINCRCLRCEARLVRDLDLIQRCEARDDAEKEGR